MYDKENYIILIRALKQALNNGLILKKVNRVIEFNQEAWLKLYINLNTSLGKKQKMISKKNFSSKWIILFPERQWKT